MRKHARQAPESSATFSIPIARSATFWKTRRSSASRRISAPNPDSGISWTEARDAAAARTYYGLQGYLVTITYEEEKQLTGEQASGTGWIGGSDNETEGTWRWVTGPEAGDTDKNVTSPLYATAVGLVMDGLSKIEKNTTENLELENLNEEDGVIESNKEDNLNEKEQKPEKTKIKRESFLDKLTKNLQDFLDNAE